MPYVLNVTKETYISWGCISLIFRDQQISNIQHLRSWNVIYMILYDMLCIAPMYFSRICRRSNHMGNDKPNNNKRHDDIYTRWAFPDSKVHEANMGPTWVLSAREGPQVGPMNLAIRVDAVLLVCRCGAQEGGELKHAELNRWLTFCRRYFRVHCLQINMRTSINTLLLCF